MANKKEDEDVEIIRNILSVNNVQVVGSLAWDKLQFLLHSLCDRISSQAARLEKAEEQGKNLAGFKEELNKLNSLCQNALVATNSEKELEAKKQAKNWEGVEIRLKAMEELMAPFKDGKVLIEIGDMPKRVSIVETSLQGTNKKVDEIDSQVKQTDSQIKELDSQVKQIDTHVLQMDNDLQELDSDFTNKEARESGMNTIDLTERIKLLETQLEEFQEHMNQITKAHTADLEALQKTQRTLRLDLEAKPLGQGTVGGGNNMGLVEIQKRLERKADVDVVDQLLRASSNTKDGLETLAKAMEELRKGTRKSARFSVKMDGLGVGGDIDSNSSNNDQYYNQIKKLEDELKSLANSLLSKVDRATIDEIQFKLASSGAVGGGGGGDGLKDLIAKKVDRSELQELLKNTQTGGGTIKDLVDKINAVNNSVVALAERSDLAVLLAKRAEQIAHPAAMIQGGSGHTDDEEIQFVVNEHANRIMVYADMLLQMQVVLATKADNLALSTLREIVEKLQTEGGGANKVALETQEKIQEQMNGTIKSHEKMLVKILEDVGLLGKGVLIMSGHDNEFHPNNISPSPALTMSTQGAIPSAPMTPNSVNNLIPTSTSSPTPTPSSPKNQVSPQNKISPISNSTPLLAPSSGPSSAPLMSRSSYIPALSIPPNLTVDSGAFISPTSHVPIIANSDGSSNPTSQRQSTTPHRKTSRFGSPSSTLHQGSIIHITNVQEASQVVADSKYHDTLVVLEDAINSKKLEPKENVAVLKRLVLEVEKMSLELENNLILIDNLEQNKVDKLDFQSLAKIVKELKAMENAMLSGKPILGFKCMSCNHDLERLNPTRGPQIPTNQMPCSYLSMLSAERIFSSNKRDISPVNTPPQTPHSNTRVNEFVNAPRKKNYVAQSKKL